VVLILGLIFVPLLPRLVGELALNALTPEASGGPYTAADLEQCYAARDALKGFPGDDALAATQLSLGMEADLPTARAQAAAAAAEWAEMARSIDAPATQPVLDQNVAALLGAKARFDEPMTANEFRIEFRPLKDWPATFTLHCLAIDRWIKANVRE
jgi:hypothetical protein